jgi:hypothetical protein
MAEHDKLPKQAIGTWERFLGLTKWALIFVVIVLIGMALFLT